MLYALNDLSRAALYPLNAAAKGIAGASFFASDLAEISWGIKSRTARTFGAVAEVLERSTRSYGKPDWGITGISCRGRVREVVEETVSDDPWCRLIRFTKKGPGRKGPKVLLVAPLSGHYATLLRGTVEALLVEHDVYVTDWKCASVIPASAGSLGLDAYVHNLMNYMRLLAPKLNVIAVCQPCGPVLSAISLMADIDDPAQPDRMVLMAGPVDAAAAPTEVTRLAEEKPLSWFRDNLLTSVPVWRPGAGRLVYPGSTQLFSFMAMNMDLHLDKQWNFFMRLVEGDEDSADAHRTFYDEYRATLDLPAEFYLDTVREIFQRRSLATGDLMIGGKKVNPGEVRRTALMTVEGEKDDISAPGQTFAAHALCSGLSEQKKRHFLQPGVGHYGVFNGRRWRTSILPEVAAFLRS